METSYFRAIIIGPFKLIEFVYTSLYLFHCTTFGNWKYFFFSSSSSSSSFIVFLMKGIIAISILLSSFWMNTRNFEIQDFNVGSFLV